MGQDSEQPTQQWQGQQQGTWQQPAGTAQASGGAMPPSQNQGQPPFPGTYQPGYGQQPQPQYQPVQSTRPRTIRRRIMTGLAIAAAFIIGIGIGAAGSSGKSTPAAAPIVTVTVTATAPPAVAPAVTVTKTATKPATSAAAPPSAAPPSAAPPSAATSAAAVTGQTVATFSGSGIKNTPQFAVTPNWKLDYTYDCSSFGGRGNFIVNEDGGNDFSGASVNELGAGGSSSTFVYNDAGTHYLSVNSECSWTVTVIDES